MKISRPEIVPGKTETEFRVNVESAAGTMPLWFRVPNDFSHFLSDASDAPAVAMLIPAMAQGEDIHLDGSISERLLYNLSGRYQRLLQLVIPRLRSVKIYAREVHRLERPATGVATGFSGGVDSYCTLADHYFSTLPGSFKLTHLLFMNVSSHGTDGEKLLRGRYAALEPIAHRIGLPFFWVNSNLDCFYGDGLGIQMTHTPRRAAAALLLQKGIGRFMYASTYRFSDLFVGTTYDMAYTDSIALPLLSTEVLDAFSVGSEYSRVEKTLRVAEVPNSYDSLNVCISGKSVRNCSTCWKCMRTLLTLEIAGMLDRYRNSFNLEAYQRRKKKYIAEVLKSHDPLRCEIIQFAASQEYSFPTSYHLYAQWRHFIKPLKGKQLARAA